MIVGDYMPQTQKRGECEAFIDGMKDGETFWTIQLSKQAKFDVKRQEDAEIISRLVKIQQKLRCL